MKLRTWRRLSALAAAVGLNVLAPPGAFAQSANPSADQWRFSLRPYLWLPSIEGNLRYGPPSAGAASPNVSIDAEKILENLDFAFMITGEARRGRWSVASDLMYIDLSGSPSAVRSVDFNPGPGPINVSAATVNLAAESSMEGIVWTLGAGYAIVQEPHAVVDILGGFRYFDIEVSTNWQLTAAVAGPGGSGLTFARTGSIEQSEDLWDAIVGVRGNFRLGASNWFVPVYADVGTGDSDLTWQAMAGIGYSYHWGEVLLVYRYLAYEQGDNKLLEDISLGGIGLGVNFRF